VPVAKAGLFRGDRAVFEAKTLIVELIRQAEGWFGVSIPYGAVKTLHGRHRGKINRKKQFLPQVL